MKYRINKNNRDKIKNLSLKELKYENNELRRKINLLKKYIIQSSIFSKKIQVELFERTEELERVKKSYFNEEEII